MKDGSQVREDRAEWPSGAEVDFEFELVRVDDDSLDEDDLNAIADIEAGRFVSHEAVVRWIESWGTENELPRPKCGE